MFGLALGAAAGEKPGGDAREGVAQEGGGSGLVVTTLYMTSSSTLLRFSDERTTGVVSLP